jgi:spore germination protein YaaH
VRVRPLFVLTSTAVVLAATVVASAPTAGAAASAPPAPRRIVSGWMPYWTTDSSTADVVANADMFSDVSPFWYSARSAGVIAAQISSSTRVSTVARLHAASVPVIPTVTDGTGAHSMAAILGNATARTEHVNTLVGLVLSGGFDGIDLDYENFAFADGQSTWASTRVRWDAFIAQLGTALHAHGKMLAVDVPYMTSPSNGYWVYDYASIGRYVDRLRIMTYDWSVSRPGPIAPISWVRQVAAFAVTQLPASKVQIGVASYGRDWPLSTTGCPVDNWPYATAYTTQQAESLAASLHITPTWNSTYAERTFNYRQTYRGHSSSGGTAACTITRTVWYDDASSALVRSQLVGQYALGGIAMWTVGGESSALWTPLRAYARTIAPIRTSVTAAASPTSVVYPAAAVVSGVLRRSDGSGLPGVKVALQSRAVGGTTWVTTAVATSSVTGALSATVKPPMADMQYRWVVPSSYSITGSVSSTLTLPVSIPGAAVYTAAGYHTINGRQWHTTCERFGSASTRCWVFIYATQTVHTAAGYVTSNGWVFNNLTYTGPAPAWNGSRLARPGSFTSGGSNWRVTCTPNVSAGARVCIDSIWSSAISRTSNGAGGYTYSTTPKWVFNDVVKLSAH